MGYNLSIWREGFDIVEKDRTIDEDALWIDGAVLGMTKGDFVDSVGYLFDGHGKRVGEMARFLMAMLPEEIQDDNYPGSLELGVAGRLHDIGKAMTPKEILDFPGKLSPEQRHIMNHHTQDGLEVLDKSGFNFSQKVRDGIVGHHEKYNGMGYPGKLKGTDIPVTARLLAIADVVDALMSPRAYKEGLDEKTVRSILEKEKGEAFDPIFCECALQHLGPMMEIGKRANLVDYTYEVPERIKKLDIHESNDIHIGTPKRTQVSAFTMN